MFMRLGDPERGTDPATGGGPRGGESRPPYGAIGGVRPAPCRLRGGPLPSPRAGSSSEDVLEPLDRRLTPDLPDRVRQRNLLRTHLHAVLRVATVRDAAGSHERVEPLGAVQLAGRVEVH